MSSVPARIRGWFATNPTGIPPNRANAVTICLPTAARAPGTRRRRTATHHVAHVVRRRLAVGMTVRSSGVDRRTESLTGARGGISSVLDGKYSNKSATAPSTSSDSTLHSPLGRRVRRSPPNSPSPTSCR